MRPPSRTGRAGVREGAHADFGGRIMKLSTKFGVDRIAAAIILITIIAMLAMFIGGSWEFPFP